MSNTKELANRIERLMWIRDVANDSRNVVTMTPGLIVSDEDGSIVWADQLALRMFGYDLDEMTTLQTYDLIPHDFRESHAEGMRQAFASGHGTLGDRVLAGLALRKGGEEFPVAVSPVVKTHERFGKVCLARIYDQSERHLEYGVLLRIRGVRR